jgi:hypothetical protein
MDCKDSQEKRQKQTKLLKYNKITIRNSYSFITLQTTLELQSVCVSVHHMMHYCLAPTEATVILCCDDNGVGGVVDDDDEEEEEEEEAPLLLFTVTLAP